jgi:outer membrane receptor protein involved in Fe transport
MSYRLTNTRALRSLLLLGTASVVAAALAMPAVADTVETVVVTGSLIPTPNATSNSPILTVGAEAIDLSGRANVEDIMNSQPQLVAALNRFSNNPGGETFIDLRGLGANRNLVLIDGRRAMSASPAGEVDIETIPASLIDHVDIVSGGGAATYGSDAISGVINFVLKKDFEGFQTQLRYGQEIANAFSPEKGINAMVGVNTADGKGNVTIYGEWYKRAGTFQSEDPRFAIDFATGSSRAPQGTLSNPNEGFNPLSMGGASAFCTGLNAQYSFKSNGDPEGLCGALAPIPGNPIANALANNPAYSASSVALGGDRYNFAPVNYLLTPETRFSFAGMGHYDVFPGIELFGSFRFTDNVITTQLAPTPVFTQTGIDVHVTPNPACAAIGTRPGNGNVLCDPDFFGAGTHNPNMEGFTSYITPAFQAQIDARAANINPATGLPYGYSPFQVVWRSAQLGARTSINVTDSYQGTLGLRGQFGNFLGGWDWTAYYDFGKNNLSNQFLHNVQSSHFTTGLESCPAGSPNGCVPINIFGFGNLSPAMMSYLNYDTHDLTFYQRQIAHGETHGTVFDLPAGPLTVAVGGEYRKDEAQFLPDASKSALDVVGGTPAKPTRGTYDVSEFFAETRIPLLSGMDFVEYLGLEGGYRYSYYSNAHGQNTWKAGGEYQPIDDLRFRVMWQRALRAPNVSELFAGGTSGALSIVDPCASRPATPTTPAYTPSVATQASCTAQFAAVGLAYPGAGFIQQNNQADGVIALGNPALQPEISNTFSAGAVITPTFLPGVTASVDYTHIIVSNFIGGAFGGQQQILDNCINNNGGTGTRPFALFLTSYGNECDLVTRLPDGAPQFNIPSVNSASLGSVRVGSLDMQINAQHDLAGLFGQDGDWGAVDVTASGSYLTQWFDPSLGNLAGRSSGGSGLTDNIGGLSELRPKFSSTVGLGYTMEDWRAMITWRHISHIEDSLGAGANVPAYNKFDAAVRWNFSENYSATLAMTNIFNKGPQLGPYSAEGQVNALCTTYDCFGREASIALTAKL